jgi:dTMP kinase
MDISFFERTQARYRQLAAEDDSVITIDASQSIEQVSAAISAALESWLSSQG